MEIETFSSAALSRWWRFVYFYLGCFLTTIFCVFWGGVHWMICLGKMSGEFSEFFLSHIWEGYLLLAFFAFFNAFLGFVFSRLATVQVNRGLGVVYINGVKKNKGEVRFVLEIVVFDMLFSFLREEGRLIAWIPRKSPYRDAYWPIPFLYRKVPRNKYVKIMSSML